MRIKNKGVFFTQGSEADSVYYLQRGPVKLTVAPHGKEITIRLLSAGDFIGEEARDASAGIRMATATAITACTALKIDRKELKRVLQDELISPFCLSVTCSLEICGHRPISSPDLQLK